MLACASGLIAGAAQPGLTTSMQWFEAENYASQSGSTAAKFDMPTASGGACVDHGWGGQTGHFLRYKLELASDFPVLYVTLRYARELAGDSMVGVTLDGETNQTRILQLPSTGDWGFQPQGWKYATLRLPATTQGTHTLELRSLADRNNVNFDGFYLTTALLETNRAVSEPPSGPEAVAPLGEGLFPLPCRTPVALPYARLKAFVDGGGLVQSLLSTPEPSGMGGNLTGPSLHVKLAGHGPWQQVEQRNLNSPVPTVVTRLKWPEVELEQAVFAATPEDQGFFVRVTVTNKTAQPRIFDLVSLVRHSGAVSLAEGPCLLAQGKPLLRACPAPAATAFTETSRIPGPLGGGSQLRHTVQVAGQASASFDLQFLGDGLSPAEAWAAATRVWQEKLAPAMRVSLPDPKLQYAFDASLRQMLTLIESRPDHARILKGLQNYYGANPYDTFQVSRALDAVGLKTDAAELLRHQLRHLKDDGIFEMWEAGQLRQPGVEQWIVQGLAATALWDHYELWHDEAWLREIAPALVRAAQATLSARRAHAGPHSQGAVEVTGWLRPIGGDGGLGVGYHWSQNAGPLQGVRIAAQAARRLSLPEADELEAGRLDFQRAFDQVRTRAAQADPERMLPAFPGATGASRTRPLWGVVMSVSAFDAIPPADPAAVRTLRFLQTNLFGGLHLNLGYSRGTWPYLSAEVALWHLRLGEPAEAWRILEAMVARASSTVCWYEEIDHQPPQGHGDAADVWAAAECVYLTSQLLAQQRGEELYLASGFPAGWMRPGQELKAENLPTPWGSCSFTLHFSDGAVLADLSLPGGQRPKQVHLGVAPPSATSWEVMQLTGAPSHRRDGRDLIISVPTQQVRFQVRWR